MKILKAIGITSLLSSSLFSNLKTVSNYCLMVSGLTALGCSTLIQKPLSEYKIVAGGPQNCIYSQESISCWGWNYYGGVGNGQREDVLAPERWSRRFANLQSLSLGSNHGCLLDDGDVYCWGWNLYNQVGIDAGDSVPSPTKVPLEDKVKIINTRGSHSCAVTFRDEVYCWGKNFYGQTGGDFPSHSFEKSVSRVQGLPQGEVKVLDTNYHHSCAQIDSDLWCWGWNEMGQLGREPDSQKQPLKVPLPSGQIERIALGSFHTCAVVDNNLYCWGRNDLGQLGLEDLSDHHHPTKVETIGQISDLQAGYKHTCYKNQLGLYCTGWSKAGQLGYSTSLDFSSKFKKVPFEVDAKDEVSIGYAHNCLRKKNEFWCWGSNRFYQLANDDLLYSSKPVKIKF